MAQTVLFGGTFDPVHNAHIEIAQAALSRFGAAKILFVPAAHPPHKSEGAYASYEDRIRMAELASAGEPAFEVSRVEEGTAQSYSILTIRKLEVSGCGRLGFLIGADAFADIQTWHRWQEVVDRVDFVVVTRPGARYQIPPGASVREMTGLGLNVSSSDIRKRLAEGDDTVPVAATVLDYIRAKALYQSRSL